MLAYDIKSLDDLFDAISKSNSQNNREDRIELNILDNDGYPYYELSILSKDDNILLRDSGNNLDYLISNVVGEFLIAKEILQVKTIVEGCVLDVIEKNNGVLLIDKNEQLDQKNASEIFNLATELLSVGYSNREFPALSSYRDLDEFLGSIKGVVLETIDNTIEI